MFASGGPGGGSTVEKLTAELSKKTVQMDMMETSLYKIKEELEQSKKALADLRKVCVCLYVCIRESLMGIVCHCDVVLV